MQANPILVAGAGPTGLVLALSLVRRGVPVRIIDRNAGPGQASRAMVVHARNLEFYQQLGFAEGIVQAGIKIDTFHLREGGAEVASFTFGDIGEGLSPYPFLLCYPQDDHERLLGDKLREASVEIEWNTALKSFTQDDAAVHAVLERDGTEERCDTPYLCGCDGIHSAVRTGLALDFPGGSYDQLFYVADVETEAGGTEMFLSLDANSFGLKLPVRSSGMQRLIGLVPPELSTRRDLAFEDIRNVPERLLGVQVRRVNWFSAYHVHHRVAAHFRVGRCFIAGDAGHVHSPVGGQGMNTGIGDAINLAWKLADVVRGRVAPAVLDSYEPERIAFARLLVASTDRLFKGVAGQGLGSEVLRTWLMPHLFPFLTGFSAVRRALFRAVSQVRIAYHDSPLSQGRAGHVEAGDRLPWVPSSDRPEGHPSGRESAGRTSADNFAPLRSLDWQVHVYGKLEPELQPEAEELGLALHAFAWTETARHAGLREDALYLIRPDGYVALAAAHQRPGQLRDYAARVGLRSASDRPDCTRSGRESAGQRL